MIRGRGGEESKTLTSGRRGGGATHEDVPIEEARKNQEGVIADEKNYLNKLGY